MWIVTAKCLEIAGGTSISLICGRNWSARQMTKYQESGCSRGWMQQLEMNAGWRLPDDMPEPAASVMRMSADGDDQADQQHELADPCMAETHWSVLNMLWPQLCSPPVVVNAASGGLQGRQWCGRGVEAETKDELQRWSTLYQLNSCCIVINNNIIITTTVSLICTVLWTSTDSSDVCRGKVLQKNPRQSGSSKMYARILVSSRTQFKTMHTPIYVIFILLFYYFTATHKVSGSPLITYATTKKPLQ